MTIDSSFVPRLRHYIKFRLRLETRPAQKTYEHWAARRYNPVPRVSFILQSHNRSKPVAELVAQLRGTEDAEILVIDDGSGLSHTRALSQILTGANEFLIRSNDLYEVITYDRAIHFARGTYVALLQDDDGFDDLRWVHDAITLFEAHPNLAILGGKNGITLLQVDLTEDGVPGPWEVDGYIFKKTNVCKGEHVATAGRTDNFQFVQVVNRAPMWLHRAHFVSTLRHIDQSYAPLQWDDAELCLRAWLAGLEVAWYPAAFQVGKYGKGGTRIWNNELVERQCVVNGHRLYRQYGPSLQSIVGIVEEANSHLSGKRAPERA